MAWWGTKTAEVGTYLFDMVAAFSRDPRNIVHDIEGDFVLEDGETIEEAQQKITDEYIGMNRHLRGSSAQILKFNYRKS